MASTEDLQKNLEIEATAKELASNLSLSEIDAAVLFLMDVRRKCKDQQSSGDPVVDPNLLAWDSRETLFA